MEKHWIILIIIGILIVLSVAWYLLSPLFIVVEKDEPSPLSKDETMKRQIAAMKDKVIEKKEAMPVENKLLTQGIFEAKAHDVKGKALLFSVDGKHVVRFEDFETINGPDLRIYLSADLAAEDFVELGKIKATKGNVNYNIPIGTDTEKYKHVLVWCKPFGVLFSSATLQ